MTNATTRKGLNPVDVYTEQLLRQALLWEQGGTVEDPKALLRDLVALIKHQTPTDPNDDANRMWGCTVSAEIRQHPTICWEGDNPRVSETQTVMALHHMDNAPRSPEHLNPWLISASDCERLRDLLDSATERGLLSPRLHVQLADPTTGRTPA